MDAFLQERRAMVEKALAALLPTPAESPAGFAEALAHAVQSGGKRLRPVFCLACAEAAGGTAGDALNAACAIELLHTYTLVHDDLPCMDNDTLRRGKPTVWAAYGEAAAVLCGDALQALAFETAAATGDIELVRELARAAGPAGVIAGQVVDIRYDGHPTRELLDYVFRHKTGDLFRCACRMGALSAHAGEEALSAITVFAEHLGLAFQIEDDLLDAAQAKEDAKPELSCLDLMSEEAARDWCRSETEAAVAALDAPGLVPEAAQNLATLARSLVSRKV